MNLTVNGKASQHGLSADVCLPGSVASARRFSLSDIQHRICRKPDRYARVPGHRATKARGRRAQCDAAGQVPNRRFVARRIQPSAGMTQRKTAADGFLPMTTAGKSIVVARDDRRKIRAAQPPITHHDGRAEGLSAIDPEWRMVGEVLRESQEELRRLSAQLLTIQESERQRIAADLHDGIGQSLNLIKISMESALLLMQKGAQQEVVESLQQMIPRIRGAMAEMRDITMDLRPAMLDDLGIIPTLSWFFREFETACRDKKVEKDFSVAESDVPVPLKTTIFRILQEAMNNIVKHAAASRIRISLKKNNGMLQFSIEDNGQGFDPDGVSIRYGSSRGLGLLTMKERARSSDGIFEMESAPGQGTRILISWQHMDDAAERGIEAFQNLHALQAGIQPAIAL